MFLLSYLAHTQIWLNLPIFIILVHKIDRKNIDGSCSAHCLVRSSWWSPRSSCTEVVIVSIPRVSSSYDVRRHFIFLYQVLGYEKRILVIAQKQKSIPICQNHLNNLVSFLVAHVVPRHTHLPCFDYPSRPPHLLLHCILPRNATAQLFHKRVHSLHRPHYHEPNVSWHEHLRDPVMRLLS
jgi:hypothetical protein